MQMGKHGRGQKLTSCWKSYLRDLADLAPSDLHLFDSLKEALKGKDYGGDEEVETTVRNWLHHPSLMNMGYIPSFIEETLLQDSDFNDKFFNCNSIV